MITSGEELLSKIRLAFPEVATRQVFPYLRARIVAPRFAELSDDEREALLAKTVDLS